MTGQKQAKIMIKPMLNINQLKTIVRYAYVEEQKMKRI